MIPILYESNERLFTSNGLGRLRDCIECRVTEERNSIYECDFSYPVNGQNFEEIQFGRIIAVEHDDSGDVQPFDIVSASKPINGVVEFHAVHISYRLSGYVFRGTSTAVNDLSTAFHQLDVDARPSPIPFTFETDKESTGYAAAFNGVPQTVRAMLGGVEGSILDTYGGEYEWNRWRVILHQSRGTETDFSIRYGVNMLDYNDDTDFSESYSSVVAYWTNPDGAAKYTGVINASQPSPIGRDMCVPLDLTDKFENEPTTAQLESMARSILEANRPYLPSQTIAVDFIRLQDTPEYQQYSNLMTCKLCDTVRVIMPMYNTEGRFKVVKTVWNVLLDAYDEMELGTLSTTLSEALGIDTGGGGSTSTTTGAVYTDTKTVAISSTDIDNNTQGASITVPPGTYAVVSTWRFNTRSTSGTTNSAVRILDGNNTILAQTRIFAAGNNWNSLQCSAIVVASAQTTLTVCGATSRAYTSGQPTDIMAVRII